MPRCEDFVQYHCLAYGCGIGQQVADLLNHRVRFIMCGLRRLCGSPAQVRRNTGVHVMAQPAFRFIAD